MSENKDPGRITHASGTIITPENPEGTNDGSSADDEGDPLLEDDDQSPTLPPLPKITEQPKSRAAETIRVTESLLVTSQPPRPEPAASSKRPSLTDPPAERRTRSLRPTKIEAGPKSPRDDDDGDDGFPPKKLFPWWSRPLKLAIVALVLAVVGFFAVRAVKSYFSGAKDKAVVAVPCAECTVQRVRIEDLKTEKINDNEGRWRLKGHKCVGPPECALCQVVCLVTDIDSPPPEGSCNKCSRSGD